MERIKLTEKHIYTGNLILVNVAHPLRLKPDESSLLRIRKGLTGTQTRETLAEDRQERTCRTVAVDPQARTSMRKNRKQEVWLAQGAGKLLLHLLDTIDYKGQIVVASGYRTRREQQEIYEQSLHENGEEFTAKYVALPDCSEHQTGLALDLARDGRWIDPIRPDFPHHGICQIFREKAPAFGFIERYPKGKEDRTKIAQEPWHFRYVGFPHSVIMTERNMVLEEYVEFLKNFPVGQPPFVFERTGVRIEISYLALTKNPEGESFLALPENEPFQLSGNNRDGLILTRWRKPAAWESGRTSLQADAELIKEPWKEQGRINE